MDDIATVDPDLAEAISDNTRRYSQLFSQVVQEMLPELKDKEVDRIVVFFSVDSNANLDSK